jgi:hypothetical protein
MCQRNHVHVYATCFLRSALVGFNFLNAKLWSSCNNRCFVRLVRAGDALGFRQGLNDKRNVVWFLSGAKILLFSKLQDRLCGLPSFLCSGCRRCLVQTIHLHIYPNLRRREAIHSHPLCLHGVPKDGFLPHLRFSVGQKTGDGFPRFFF